KHHATGALGGVVFTQDEELYWRVKRVADRGKPFNTDVTSNLRAGLNLNGSDLAAAIGRVQLRKLPAIIQRRCEIAMKIQEGIAGMKAVSVGWRVPNTEGVYWFMRVCVDTSKLKVDKDTFARAVAAEGIPVIASYRHIPAEAIWFRERRVFGTSDYPWGLPAYEGNRNAEFPCPNAVAAVTSHFVLSLHENYGRQEVEDIVKALEKVERAYLR
ncbi:MAG: DegT/DnrJ/EryC1/StrS family aminotransferase, partial [Candidatus Latescibacteria bacterium]|nr:DegT/DnrJ/EryC1/StrS family aminotransferase [Candidatus Latescibacterota bacterium]